MEVTRVMALVWLPKENEVGRRGGACNNIGEGVSKLIEKAERSRAVRWKWACRGDAGKVSYSELKAVAHEVEAVIFKIMDEAAQ